MPLWLPDTPVSTPGPPTARSIAATRTARDEGQQTARSIAAARAARDAERASHTRVTGDAIEEDGRIAPAAPRSAFAMVRGMRTNPIDPDDGRIALTLANFVASAVYGPQGEGR